MKVEDRIKYTKDGYSYVEITPTECLNWGGFCVCNGCNGQFLNEPLYLCYLLGDVYCKDCFDEIMSRTSSMSKEDLEHDLQFQKENDVAYYKAHLNI